MLKFLFLITVSFLINQNTITSSELVEFENKFYLANSYNPYSGKLIDYYDNGIIMLHGNLDKGHKIDDWFEFYNDGSVKSQKSYKKNKIIITYFDQNQTVVSTGIKLNNKKDGKWVYFDSSGIEIEYLFYSNGILDSTLNLVKKIYADTVKIAIIEKDSLKIFDDKIINKIDDKIDDKIGKDIKDGEYITKYSSGRYLVENYKNGILHGPHIIYHKNGFKSIDRFFVNGNIDRITSEFNNIGVLISKYHEYLNNNNIIDKNGEYISYHPNGKIFQEGIMISGYRYGYWIEYNDKGSKNREIYYDVDPLSLNQKYIITNITTFYNNGNKNLEYIVYTYDKCLYSDEECSAFLGNKINLEILNGDFNSFYSNGQLKSEGNYLNDNKIGTWVAYYISGVIKSTTKYVNDIGHFTSFFENHPNKIYQLGFYKNGFKSGEWKEYNINAEMIKSYFMNKGLVDINEPFTIYYESDELENDINYKGQKKIEFHCSGNEDDCIYSGLYKKYFPNNQLEIIGNYKNNNKFGKWNYFYLNGSLNNEEIFDEYGNGTYKSYYITGELKATGRYRDNLKDGKWIYYYKNKMKEWVIFYLHDNVNPNQLSSKWYESGYKNIEGYLKEFSDEVIWDDKYIEYYENGIISKEGYYNKNKKNGKWIEYYTNRVMKNSGYYIDNKQFGEWEYYSHDGILIEKKYFD